MAKNQENVSPKGSRRRVWTDKNDKILDINSPDLGEILLIDVIVDGEVSKYIIKDGFLIILWEVFSINKASFSMLI